MFKNIFKLILNNFLVDLALHHKREKQALLYYNNHYHSTVVLS
jgi:hypothetical protein